MRVTIKRLFRSAEKSFPLHWNPAFLVGSVGVLSALFVANVALGAQSTSLGGLSGIKEFLASGTFIVPANTSTILVEIYGGGGGGGGNVPGIGGYGGCSGGAGAFSRSVIKVTPQTTLNISVGQRGLAGVSGNPATNGGDGGDSYVSFNGSPLITAYGGKGGQSGSNLTPIPGGFECTAAAGGGVDPTAMISHAGMSGNSSGYVTGYQLIGLTLGKTASNAGAAAEVGGYGYILFLW